MNKEKGLWKQYFICTILLLVCPSIFPKLHLTYFAPFIVLQYYKLPLLPCLGISFGCGLTMDLLSNFSAMGFHTINYCLTTWILYDKKRLFFEDSLISIPIMTTIFSTISSAIQVTLLKFFGAHIPLSWQWLFSDLFIMSVVDGLYGFILFIIPTLFKGFKQQKPSLLKRPK